MAILNVAARGRSFRGVRGSLRLGCAVCGLLLLRGFGASAQTTPTREYQVKAVFLFNFAQFVEWPVAAFTDRNAAIVIGVLGENPFGAYLNETVRGETVNNRPLEVQHYRQIDEIKTCHVLFISPSEANRIEPILDRLKNRSILVVGDTDDFIKRGGMVGLATTQNKVRLIVNVEAARAANLTISSKLLRSAEVVTRPK